MAETKSSQNPTIVPNDSDAKSCENSVATNYSIFKIKRVYLLLSALTGTIGGLIYMGSMMLLFGDQDKYLNLRVALFINGIAGGQFLTAFFRDNVKLALVAAFVFTLGLVVPVVAVGFIKDYHVRLIVIMEVVSLALIGYGWTFTHVRKGPKLKSIVTTLLIGWLVMGAFFGSAKFGWSH